MALNYVTLTVDLIDGAGNTPEAGWAVFTPTVTLTDTTDNELVGTLPVSVPFTTLGVAPTVRLLATDNASLLPAGWAWNVQFSAVAGAPAAYNFFLPFTGGASQYLSSQTPVSTAVTQFPANPMLALGDMIYGAATGTPTRLPGNTATTAAFLTQTGTGAASAAPAWEAAPAALATLGGLGMQASTGVAGFALQNATPTILSWTAPNDGQLHRGILFVSLFVSSAATGGQVNLTWTQPGGNVFNPAVFAASQGSGGHLPTGGTAGFNVAAGSAVTLNQATALTAGAATLWAEIWGL